MTDTPMYRTHQQWRDSHEIPEIIGYDRDGRAIRPGNLCLVVPSRTERQPPLEWLCVLGVAIEDAAPGRTVGPRVWLRSPLFVKAEGEVVVWCSALQRITGAPYAQAGLALAVGGGRKSPKAVTKGPPRVVKM